MKFSETVASRLPKRTIPPEEYTLLARSRYHPRYGMQRTERINAQELAHMPGILQKLGFVVVRNILADSAAQKAQSASLRNKTVKASLQEAWQRTHATESAKPAYISWISNDPYDGVRFNQPGHHVVLPAEGTQEIVVTKRWQNTQTYLRPGDALVWDQPESGFFPQVEVVNTSQHYIGMYVLHDSVTYAHPPVAPLPPPVSQ